MIQRVSSLRYRDLEESLTNADERAVNGFVNETRRHRECRYAQGILAGQDQSLWYSPAAKPGPVDGRGVARAGVGYWSHHRPVQSHVSFAT
jgi:hypothetical protein